MRIDFIFSYWIFFWYLLYISGYVSLYNPKIAIICGLAENMLVLLAMIYFRTNWKLILLFITMMILLKIIPLYTLWNKPIRLNDIYYTIGLFCIYLVWAYINGKTPNDFMENTRRLIIDNKNTLPGMQILEEIIIS